MASKYKRYILWFAQEHVDFREAEIHSITKLFNINWTKSTENSQYPFWVVELPGEEAARKLASRSISLRCVLELWSHSNVIAQFHKYIKEYIAENSESVKPYFSKGTNFKITVETYNKHFTQKEKVEKIELFDYLPLQGQVDLRQPDVEWYYIEFYGLDPKDCPDIPYDVLFGRWIANGQRNLIKELSLKKRKFIGNTSMDPQLSLIMANQALVTKGNLVFDPFVGTGSLLVSAAMFGGYVLGSDIDYLMVHAKSRPSRITQKQRDKDESIRANLKQYKCDQYYIDTLVADFSNPLWSSDIRFSSIITDPPYGIREATERINTKISKKSFQPDENTPHYPSTSHYSLQNLYTDLLEFAAYHLEMHGRLVCWLPIYKDDYTEELIPKNENLILISNSEQTLTGMTSRRLLTYEKIFEPSQTLHSFNSFVPVPVEDFRYKYFSYGEETRSERRIRRAELREIGRQEALKRGKKLDENGKVLKNK